MLIYWIRSTDYDIKTENNGTCSQFQLYVHVIHDIAVGLPAAIILFNSLLYRNLPSKAVADRATVFTVGQ